MGQVLTTLDYFKRGNNPDVESIMDMFVDTPVLSNMPNMNDRIFGRQLKYWLYDELVAPTNRKPNEDRTPSLQPQPTLKEVKLQLKGSEFKIDHYFEDDEGLGQSLINEQYALHNKAIGMSVNNEIVNGVKGGSVADENAYDGLLQIASNNSKELAGGAAITDKGSGIALLENMRKLNQLMDGKIDLYITSHAGLNVLARASMWSTHVQLNVLDEQIGHVVTKVYGIPVLWAGRRIHDTSTKEQLEVLNQPITETKFIGVNRDKDGVGYAVQTVKNKIEENTTNTKYPLEIANLLVSKSTRSVAVLEQDAT